MKKWMILSVAVSFVLSEGVVNDVGKDIKITEINMLKNTNINNSIIHQGLITINNQTSVSNTFKRTQQNRMKQISSTGEKSETNSTIIQGHIEIDGGATSNTEQNIQNIIKDITIDGSVKQSSM